MFGSSFLDVAIGLVFVYLVLSLVCTALREGLETWMKTRAAYLERGIRELLQDAAGTGLAAALYKHPLIYGLFAGGYAPKAGTAAKAEPPMFARGGNLPSYIPTRNFALALLDLAARGPITDGDSANSASTPISLDAVRANVSNLGNPAVQRAVLAALDVAQGDFDRAVASLEAWYDSAMDRVSGWYKRSTQQILLAVAIALAVLLNVNTFTIADYLFHNEAARTALANRAQATANDPAVLQEGYAKAMQTLADAKLPIGWDIGWAREAPDEETDIAKFLREYVYPVLGLLLTGLAVSLGAPFWFDVLNKLMVIRSTVKPREKSPEEGSEDRQPKGGAPGKPTSPVPPAPPPGAAQATRAPVAPAPAAPASAAAALAGPVAPATQSAPHVDACIADWPPATRSVTPDAGLPAARGGVAKPSALQPAIE